MIKKYYTIDEAVKEGHKQEDVKLYMPKSLGESFFYLGLGLFGIKYKRFYVKKEEDKRK